MLYQLQCSTASGRPSRERVEEHHPGTRVIVVRPSPEKGNGKGKRTGKKGKKKAKKGGK